MQAKIIKAGNGYILKVKETLSDGTRYNEYTISEERGGDDKKSEQEAFVDLIWNLMEYFGVPNSKKDRSRINIEIIYQEEN